MMIDEATEDQKLLLDASIKLIETIHPVEAVRGGMDPDRVVEYRLRTADLGWYSMLVPEHLGGGSVTGNGLLDACLIAFVRGRMLQPASFVDTNVTAWAIATAGTALQQSAILPALMSGQQSATWVTGTTFDEPGAGRGIAAVPSSDGAYVLSGKAFAVPEAESATLLLITTDSADGQIQFLLPSDTPGIVISRLESLDNSRHFGAITFDQVIAPTDAVLGTTTPVADMIRSQIAIASALAAAETVGAMDRDFEMAVQYAKDRIAFGRPIGSFQAIKHVLADQSLSLEMGKSITLAAAESLGTGDGFGPQAASMAKAFVGDAGIELAQHCFQIFGGIGYTSEHDQHLYLRRLTADATFLGSPSWHRERLCQLAEITPRGAA